MHLLNLNHNIDTKIWDMVLLGKTTGILEIRMSELEEILEIILFSILTEDNQSCTGHADNNRGRI